VSRNAPGHKAVDPDITEGCCLSVDLPESNSATSFSRDSKPLEDAFRGLWERVTRAGELIQNLREDRKALALQVEQLRNEIRTLQDELQKKDAQLRQTKVDAESASVLLANGEREALAVRVKELLSRIDAYL
jgi:peptidoglycan hydrolase CwlO-like protein